MFDVVCLKIYIEMVGFRSLGFEKQNNEMGMKWGSLKCWIIFEIVIDGDLKNEK